MRSLVIDDEFVALSKMVGLLRPLGDCDAATSGEQALNLFLRALTNGAPYDLITIDINMPDMNGITLLSRFQAEEKVHCSPASRKLMVTADSSASNVRAALAGDCDGFIVKPIKRAVLADKLASLHLVPEHSALPQASEG